MSDDVEEDFETNEEPIEDTQKDEIDTPLDRLHKEAGRQRKSHIMVIDVNTPISQVKSDIHKCENPECTQMTNRHSGYCGECEKILGPYLNTEVLRCSNCFVISTCPNGKNKWGVCIYELEADRSNMKEREAIEDEMRIILQRDKKMAERFSRLTSSLDLSSPENRAEYLLISKEMKQWQQLFLEHLKVYSTFKGWTQIERGDLEALKIKAKSLDKVVGRGVQRNAFKKEPVLKENELKPLIVTTPISGSLEERPVVRVVPVNNTEDEIDGMEQDIQSQDMTLQQDLLELEQIEATYQDAKQVHRYKAQSDSGGEEDGDSEQSENTTDDSE
jgi:hypothetical protein